MDLTQRAVAPLAVADTAGDDQLAAAARTEPDSFAPLYVRHVEPVYRYILAGSVAASGGLFDNLIDGSPVLEDMWGSAHDVGTSVTDLGYTIVLEKAAVDSERLWVALSLVDSGSPTDFGQMQVTDANGVVLTAGTGAGTGDVAGESATIFGFTIPDGVTAQGPFTLEVTSVTGSDGLVAGHWTFTFDVPAAGS